MEVVDKTLNITFPHKKYLSNFKSLQTGTTEGSVQIRVHEETAPPLRLLWFLPSSIHPSITLNSALIPLSFTLHPSTLYLHPSLRTHNPQYNTIQLYHKSCFDSLKQSRFQRFRQILERFKTNNLTDVFCSDWPWNSPHSTLAWCTALTASELTDMGQTCTSWYSHRPQSARL